MTKRSVEDVENGNQAYLKRQKISKLEKGTVPAEEIRSGRQLSQTLAFDQDSGRSKRGKKICKVCGIITDVLAAIKLLKAFLDGFSATEADNVERIRVLKEFLDLQKPSDGDDKAAVFLTDVMQTWSFASQSNDESLLSAIPAVLALLLRTLSNILEFSEYGLRLGRTLLKKRQQELIARGITANKSKEFVISPALRLLKELTIFDGGSLAKQVFRARDQLFKNLARNLTLRFTGDAIEDRRRPSVRTNATRFVLACIKFLPTEAKCEFLSQRDIVTALTRDIKDDPPFVVREILEALKVYVLQDEALVRDVKAKILNATSLGRIATLYKYDQPDKEVSIVTKSVATLAHEFLILACTSHVGILNRQTGFYPRGIDPDDTHDLDPEHDFIDLGLDSIEWANKFKEKVPVRNTILSDFIQKLRPWSSVKQTELLLSILETAPELTADYFFGKKSFSFEPKLTATWIGYSAFLYSALQLPVPKYLGHQGKYARLPPPISIVLESLLPQPLNQKVLTRCLNQPHNLITFFAVRLLCVSLAKLQKFLSMYHEASSGESQVWVQAAERLTDEYCQRCPSIKDIISAFRNLPSSDLLQREATARLLVMYYEVIPRVALDAKFDVAGTLAKALKEIEDSSQTPEDRALRVMELENIIQFANFSPGMRWFSKADSLEYSPFMAILKLSAESSANIPLLKLQSTLELIAKENQIFQTQTSISVVDSFVLCLKNLEGIADSGPIYKFLDDCISRVASKSVKYIFSLEELQAEAGGLEGMQFPVSLLTLAILEQWPFFVKTIDNATLQSMADFLAQYLSVLIKIKENKKVIKIIIKKLAEELPKGSPVRKTIERSRKLADATQVPEMKVTPAAQPEQVVKSKEPSESEKEQVLTSMLGPFESKSEGHSSLTRWISKEADEVIEQGHAAALIMLLSSEHLSVRKEAAISISKFAAKLNESTFEEREQIWLLLSEVVETARKTIDSKPLPTVLSSFASHAVAVLNNPLHCLYPKVNKFLSQGPTWELNKIPLLYKIMDDAPSLDDAHYLEIAWLLDYMFVGLRTPADMAIYRTRRVFEKILSLYNNPYLAPGLREKILKILFRATTIEGGSTTLITRFSIMTWLQAQVALGGGLPLKVLIERIFESCDHSRVDKWSNGGVEDMKAHTLKM
jgi:nucleolar pre-ribosomal-associated protein 1